MTAGNLRVSDLARWFDRPHATVSTWVKEGREPTGTPTDVGHFFAFLGLLEKLIKTKRGFPVPHLSQGKRIKYIMLIRLPHTNAKSH